jgi:hypothetical protein
MSTNWGAGPGADPNDMRDPVTGRLPEPGQGQYPNPYQPPGQPQYSGPSQPAYPPPPPPASRRRGGFVGLAVLLVVAVAIGGFFLFRDRLSNEVGSLEPGQCFDRPAEGQSTVTDVQRQPCNEPHDAEVFANVTHTAAAGAPYPATTEFDDLAGDECIPALQTYTGLSLAELVAMDLNFGYFYPTSDGWGHGDRVVTCYTGPTDGSKTTGSLRNTGAGASASP